METRKTIAMGFFNFPGQQDHRTFNYRPIYYDKDEEERKRIFGKVDGSLEKEKKEGKYVPGSYIKGSLRNGNYERRRSSDKFQIIIGIVGLVLLFVILIYFTKFFSLL
ncbi:MAG: hypothetical protein PUK70_00655 [Bacteroidales bacterium]|nr:hypothetical protein [Bacteroidales bacterium]MDY6002334.1 hypothetical protein [Candidatus Cryptobacteroides sp.]